LILNYLSELKQEDTLNGEMKKKEFRFGIWFASKGRRKQVHEPLG